MCAAEWQVELAALAERFRDSGVIYDLADMSIEERFGALAFIRYNFVRVLT